MKLNILFYFIWNQRNDILCKCFRKSKNVTILIINNGWSSSRITRMHTMVIHSALLNRNWFALFFSFQCLWHGNRTQLPISIWSQKSKFGFWFNLLQKLMPKNLPLTVASIWKPFQIKHLKSLVHLSAQKSKISFYWKSQRISLLRLFGMWPDRQCSHF